MNFIKWRIAELLVHEVGEHMMGEVQSITLRRISWERIFACYNVLGLLRLSTFRQLTILVTSAILLNALYNGRRY